MITIRLTDKPVTVDVGGKALKLPEPPSSVTVDIRQPVVILSLEESGLGINVNLPGTARFINARGDSMRGPLLLAGDPVEATEAVPKQYLDDAIAAVRDEIPVVPPPVPHVEEVGIGSGEPPDHPDLWVDVDAFAEGSEEE